MQRALQAQTVRDATHCLPHNFFEDQAVRKLLQVCSQHSFEEPVFLSPAEHQRNCEVVMKQAQKSMRADEEERRKLFPPSFRFGQIEGDGVTSKNGIKNQVMAAALPCPWTDNVQTFMHDLQELPASNHTTIATSPPARTPRCLGRLPEHHAPPMPVRLGLDH